VLFVSREAHGDGWSVGPSRRVVNDLVTNTAWENCSFKSRTLAKSSVSNSPDQRLVRAGRVFSVS
jgi:hypothetical protein